MVNPQHLERELPDGHSADDVLDADPVELFVPWPGALGRALDVVALVLALSLGFCVVADLDPPGRPVLALITLISAPGWALVRAFGAPAGPLSGLGAVGLSVALTITTGQLCVTLLDWAWRPTVAVLLGLTAALSAARIIRDLPGR